MNLLDIVILLIVIVFAFQGYRNGIVKEVLTIVGVIFAVFIAFRYMNELADMLIPHFDQSEDVIILISGLIMFSATLILILTIAYLIRKFLELIKLNIINRIFGSIFGGLKSAIIISAVLLLFAGFGLPGEEARSESITYPYVIQLAPAAFNMVAAALPGTENFVNRIEETLDEANPMKHLPIFN
jgi:membrane protein required for colicin V production